MTWELILKHRIYKAFRRAPWTGDQPTYAGQHRETGHSCLGRDSNPQSKALHALTSDFSNINTISTFLSSATEYLNCHYSIFYASFVRITLGQEGVKGLRMDRKQIMHYFVPKQTVPSCVGKQRWGHLCTVYKSFSNNIDKLLWTQPNSHKLEWNG